MKVFIPVLCLMTVAMAEPPVGNGYPAARSSSDHQHDHHEHEHQRSLSQEYGPPSAFSRNSISDGYNAPNARNALNSRSYSPPTARVSFTQRFSSSPSRNSQGYAAAGRSISQDYAAPSTRSGISQEYGTPNSRSPAQEYGVPSIASARSISEEYGAPDARSALSQEYGTPVAARSSYNPQSHTSNFRSAPLPKAQFPTALERNQFQTSSLSHSNIPSARYNDVSQDYDKSAFASRSAPSSSYGSPSSRSLPTSYGAPSARSVSTSYGAPSRDSDSYSQEHNSLSQTYGTPSQRDLLDTYEAPNARGLSQEYGTPASRVNQKTIAQASSYASTRSSPSSTYLPASRDAMPSDQYGVPEQRDGDGQGYDSAKARVIDELLNQEPANYDFRYQIEDTESGSDFGHSESRLEDRAEGAYFVVLPDGTKQTVEYEADEGGFKPRISVEPVAGYDDNAADVSRAAGGPY